MRTLLCGTQPIRECVLGFLAQDKSDLVAGQSLKTLGEDIMAGKVTMPVAKGISLLPRAKMSELWETIKSKPQDPKVVAKCIKVLEDCGAIEACTEEATRLVEDAWKDLDKDVPDSFSKGARPVRRRARACWRVVAYGPARSDAPGLWVVRDGPRTLTRERVVGAQRRKQWIVAITRPAVRRCLQRARGCARLGQSQDRRCDSGSPKTGVAWLQLVARTGSSEHYFVSSDASGSSNTPHAHAHACAPLLRFSVLRPLRPLGTRRTAPVPSALGALPPERDGMRAAPGWRAPHRTHTTPCYTLPVPLEARGAIRGVLEPPQCSRVPRPPAPYLRKPTHSVLGSLRPPPASRTHTRARTSRDGRRRRSYRAHSCGHCTTNRSTNGYARAPVSESERTRHTDSRKRVCE